MRVKHVSRQEEWRSVGRVRLWAPVWLGAALLIQCGTGWINTQASTLSFLPTDDAYLQDTTRFNDSTLKVESGRRVTYLKFAVSGLSGTVQSATLRLQENGDIGNGTVRVYRGSHNNWTETTLSTANAPAESGQVGVISGAVTAAQVVNLDVTPLVNGNGTYSAIVKLDAGGNDIWFGSEESPRKPQLIIQTTGGGTVTYGLTVNSGSGSGTYAAGTSVNIGAAAAPTGQVFDRWTGDVANVGDVNAASTTIVMPAANATVTATYKTAGGGGGGSFSFLPTDDAYLQDTTRFNDSTLKVESGRRVTYLKFAVSGLSGTVQSATLRLQENGDIGNGTVRVYRGSHNNWTETTLSTANAPAESGQVGVISGAVTAAQVVNLDVTPLVNGNGTYSAIVKLDAGGNDIWFGSEESPRKPQLIIQTTGGGTVTYGLTVNSGSGSGTYAAGTSVNIGAAAAPTGQVFDRWTGDVANVGDVNAASTTIVMPAANATVTATYKTAGGGGGGSFSFLPTDDAYLQDTTRFNDSTLKVESGRRVTYLKFAVSGLSGTVQSATLRLQENGDIGNGTVRVYRGSHNNWTETTLSTANAPAESGQVGVISGAVTAAQVVNLDVTPLVNGNGTYSAIVKLDAGGNDIWFGSEESPRKPQLIIQTTGSGTVTYGLTVNSGSGSGTYAAGTSVNIGAAAAPTGQVFDRWTGDVANVGDVNAASTTIVMPAANATVTATYQAGGGIGGIEPIEGMTATGNAGMITSIHGIPVSELRLGVTFFPNPPGIAVYPARNADNFDLNLLASADGQPYFEVYFGQAVMAMLLIENGGNDGGFMQGLDAAGNLVGPMVGFSTSDYLQTSYRTGGNQIAAGLFVWMQVPVFGVRVTPPSGGLMGFDPISVSALVDEPAAPSGSLSPLSDFSEVWNGQTLLWRKARYADPALGSEGTAGIPFGLALPHGYSAGAGQEYPLVIYLHGAGARGDDDNLNLQRPTARFFAHQARTVPTFNAFVLSPQVAVGRQFVNVAFDYGPYEQSAATLTASMRLTENLVLYLTNPANNASLGAALGFSAAEVDVSRVYLVGDSMGAYGTWDTVGRGSMDYAAAIAAAGSGPVNRLAAILGTPLWVIHGEVDQVVPNFLPYLGDADGAGSLGMLGVIDPAFENTASTAFIRLDNYSSAADDPTPADTLIYSQYPAQFSHATVAAEWTGTMVSDFSSWLFAHAATGASASPQAVMSVLELVWNSNGGGWYLIWPDAQWVLQEAMSLDGNWIDVFPPASSPHPVGMEENGDQRFFRLRAAEQE